MFRAASAFVSAEQPTRQTHTCGPRHGSGRADGYNVLMREKDTKGGRDSNELDRRSLFSGPDDNRICDFFRCGLYPL